MAKKKMTLEEIENELNYMYYNLEKLCGLHYSDWTLGERIRHGQLHAMKERRIKEMEVTHG